MTTPPSHVKTESAKKNAPDVKPTPVSEGMEQSVSSQDVMGTLSNLQSARPETILRLQRVAGNRAVTRALGVQSTTRPALQRQSEETGEDEALQTKPMPSTRPMGPMWVGKKENSAGKSAKAILQTKLTVSEPGDEQEIEADQVSEQVMRMSDKTVAAPPDEDENSNPGGNAILNRYLQRSPLQRSADGIGGGPVNDATQSRIEGMQQGGRPLPDSEREFFEPRMGVDLSNVRIHTDSTAVETSKELNARAYTVGPHVAFNSGEFQPGTTEGRRLLGHELTHVVQQGAAGSLARKPKVQRAISMDEAIAEAEKEVTDEDVAKEDAKIESEPISVPTGNKLEGVAEPAAESAPGGSAAVAADAPAAEGEAVKAEDAAPAADAVAEAKTEPPVDSATAAEGAATAETAAPAVEGAEKAPAPAAAATDPKAADAKAAPAAAPAQTPVSAPAAGAAADAKVVSAEGTPAPVAGADLKAEATAAKPADEKADPASSVVATPTDQAAPVAAQPADEKTDPALPATAAPTETATPAAGGAAAAPAAGASLTVPENAPAPTETPDSSGAPVATVKPEEELTDQPLHRMPIKGVVQRYQAPKSAAEDPAFQKVIANSKAVAENEKKHEPAQAEAGKAQAAADPKGSDVEMAAEGRQVGEMKNQPTSGFNVDAFKAKLLANIEKTAPKNLKEAEDFKGNNRINEVKASVTGEVKDQKQQAEEKLEEKAEAQPDKSGLQGKDVKPLAPNATGPAPADLGAEQAAPKNKGTEEVEAPIQEQSASLDKQMGEAKITEEQLAKSNEPSFNKALDAKKTAQEDAKTAPDAYRKAEESTLAQAQTDAKGTADAKVQDTRSEREKLMAEVFTSKGETKGADESKRTEVAGKISDIYLDTKKSVEDILSKMDGEVDSKFNEGAKQAQEAFEKSVDSDMWDYKTKRYLGRLDGLLLWAEDLFKGLPEDAGYIYTNGRAVYLKKMDECLTSVAQYVAAQLNAAKARVAEGQKQIQTYVAGLSPDLKQIGVEAADQIQGKFEELTGTVDSKQDELVDSLTQKYNEKLKEVDARIDEMKLQNSGLVNQATKAIGDVIETIKKLADMLMSTLKSAAGAIELILQDPITFLGNLLTAVKQGFTQFVGNIGKYLQQGLIDWLTGAIGSAGIKLPKGLDDLPGIFNMVLDLLGLTYESIRGKVVEALGENGEAIVSGLEKAWEVFKIIKEKGLAGIWEMIQGMIGDLKEMVMGQIKDMVIGQVIEAGVKWLVGMLGGPAGAFIKAVEGIINVVTWFMNNGQRIMGIINGIISSMTAIANGDISGAANFIEGVLAKSVPTIISFLADLLGLGGIAEKVQGIIKKIQAPINKAIGWVVQKAKALAKGIMSKLKGGKKDGKKDKKESDDTDTANQMLGEDTRTVEEKQADLLKALTEADAIMSDEGATPESINAKLKGIKTTYKLKVLELVKNGDLTYHVHGEINPEGDGKTHGLYKLKGKPTTLVRDDGTTLITYETVSGQIFEVVIKDAMIKSIESKDLTFKPEELSGTRGHTATPDTFMTNAGMNRSHLIADEFMGSGYKNAFNLISTSAHYNQVMMRGAEQRIIGLIKSNNAEEFGLKVSVEWGDLNSAGFERSIRETLLKKDPLLAEDKAKFDKEVAEMLRKRNPKLKNCMGVTYDLTLKNKKGKTIKQTIYIGADQWKSMDE